MLDPEAPDERRDQIASEMRQRIEAAGSLKTEKVWGMRKLAYEISRRTEADYRFFRFETESPLLDELDHNLKITDGVLRFRVFKVDPRSPVIEPPPPMALAAAAPSRGPGRRGPGGRGRDDFDEAPAAAPEPAAAPPPAAAPEAPAADAAPVPEPEAPAPEPAAAPAAAADEAPAAAPAAESPPAEQ